jgi:hypothetical protein
MKYFTRERWKAVQRPNRAASDAWRADLEKYSQELKAILARHPADFRSFFEAADVHDGELLSCNILDGGRIPSANEKPRPWNNETPFPVAVELEVLEATGKVSWKLRYSLCRRAAIDFPTDSPLFHTEGHGFGDWGYHELSDLGNGFLRHEVLFASGSTILVEFKELRVEKVPRVGA